MMMCVSFINMLMKSYIENVEINGDYMCQRAEQLIAEIHKMYGHLGSKKCTKLLQEHFTFDKMSKQIKEYIKTCDKCQ